MTVLKSNPGSLILDELRSYVSVLHIWKLRLSRLYMTTRGEYFQYTHFKMWILYQYFQIPKITTSIPSSFKPGRVPLVIMCLYKDWQRFVPYLLKLKSSVDKVSIYIPIHSNLNSKNKKILNLKKVRVC